MSEFGGKFKQQLYLTVHNPSFASTTCFFMNCQVILCVLTLFLVSFCIEKSKLMILEKKMYQLNEKLDQRFY